MACETIRCPRCGQWTQFESDDISNEGTDVVCEICGALLEITATVDYSVDLVSEPTDVDEK